MTKWEYRQLSVWSSLVAKKDGQGWYFDVGERSIFYRLGGSKRMPLNPSRDWAPPASASESMTWDEDAGWADLLMEVVSKMGHEGWELAGIQPFDFLRVSMHPTSAYYIFKKPIEIYA